MHWPSLRFRWNDRPAVQCSRCQAEIGLCQRWARLCQTEVSHSYRDYYSYQIS